MTNKAIENSLEKAIFGKVEKSALILVTFTDGQTAEFTTASLELLKSDKSVYLIESVETGEILFAKDLEEGEARAEAVKLDGNVAAITLNSDTCHDLKAYFINNEGDTLTIISLGMVETLPIIETEQVERDILSALNKISFDKEEREAIYKAYYELMTR